MHFSGSNQNTYSTINGGYNDNYNMESFTTPPMNQYNPYFTQNCYPYYVQTYQQPMNYSTQQPITSQEKHSSQLTIIDPENKTEIDLKALSKKMNDKPKSNSLLDEIQPAPNQNMLQTNATLPLFYEEYQPVISPSKNEIKLKSTLPLVYKEFQPAKAPLINKETKPTLSTLLPLEELKPLNDTKVENKESVPTISSKLDFIPDYINNSVQNSISNQIPEINSVPDKTARKIYERDSIIDIAANLPNNHIIVLCDNEIITNEPDMKKNILNNLRQQKKNKRFDIFDVKNQLRRSTKGYLPPHLRIRDACKANKSLDKFQRSFKIILNKIAPQNFLDCANEILCLTKETDEQEDISTKDMIDCLIEEIFEKAVKEEAYSVTYAQLCSKIKDTEDKEHKKWDFKSSLLEKCKRMFDTPLQDQLDEIKRYWEAKAEQEDDKQLKKLYIDDIEEQIKKEKDKYFGNARFIGELYVHNLLKPVIIYNCINSLIPKCYSDEASSKFVCKLLATVGKKFSEHSDKMSEIIEKLRNVYDNLKDKKEFTRIRFGIKDILEMSERNWTLRTVQQQKIVQPKTLKQLQIETKKETAEQQIQLQQLTNGPKLNNPATLKITSQMKQSASDNELKMRPSINKKPDTQIKKDAIINMATKKSNSTNVSLKPCNEYWKSWATGSRVKNSDQEKKENLNIEDDNWQAVGKTPRTYKSINTKKSKSSHNLKNQQQQNDLSTSLISSSSSTNPNKALASTEQLKSREHSPSQLIQNTDNGFGKLSLIIGGDSKFSALSNLDHSDDYNESVSEDASSIMTNSVDACTKMNDKSNDNEIMSPDDMIEELINSGSINIKCWKNLKNPESFISSCLDKMMEKGEHVRHKVGDALVLLIDNKEMTPDLFITAFKEFESELDEIELDIPNIWSYLSQFFSRFIKNGSNLTEFQYIFQQSLSNRLEEQKVIICLLESIKLANLILEVHFDFDWLYKTLCCDSDSTILKQLLIDFGFDMTLSNKIKELLSKDEEDLYKFLEERFTVNEMRNKYFVQFIFRCIFQYISETPELDVVHFLDSKILFCKRQVDNKPEFEKQVLCAISQEATHLFEKDLLETVLSHIYRNSILSEDAYQNFVSTTLSQSEINTDDKNGTLRTVQIIKSLLSDITENNMSSSTTSSPLLSR